MSNTKSGVSSIRTVGAFMNGRACSDTLFYVLNRAFDSPLNDEERAAMPFAGGLMQHGYRCGMIWGSTLAAGMQAQRLYGSGPDAQARAIEAARKLVQAFRAQNTHTNCVDITEINQSSTTLQKVTYFLLKGGTVGCFRMAARFAPLAYREIDAALSEKPTEQPAGPVSCAALLAQKLGASDLHIAAVAGLAGGIGLSGGTCGALGAAIWIMGLNSLAQGEKKLDYAAPRGYEVIERFLKAADFESDCSRICGRTFESVDDHARHLREGGCAKILDALAAAVATTAP